MADNKEIVVDMSESASVGAVSYTHLDVYKRQARARPACVVTKIYNSTH